MAAAASASCKPKDVVSNTYTTTDGLVISSVAYIATFSMSCEGGSSPPSSLFAEVPTAAGGKVTLPVIRSLDGTSYQVSWAEDLAKASSGDKVIRVYDEDGYAAVRKAARKAEEAGSSTVESVDPLLALTVSHPGTYKGPLLHTEVIALFGVVLIWYTAYTTKSSLLA